MDNTTLEKRVKNVIEILQIQYEKINNESYACCFDEGWHSGITEGYEYCIKLLKHIL